MPLSNAHSAPNLPRLQINRFEEKDFSDTTWNLLFAEWLQDPDIRKLVPRQKLKN